MRVKSFTKSAQIARTPNSTDTYPGVAELEENGAMLSGAPAWQQWKSPQTDSWTSSIPSNLPRGMTEEQIFQQLSRLKNISREDLVRLQEKANGHAIIAPIVQALISDRDIRTLVGNLHDNSSD